MSLRRASTHLIDVIGNIGLSPEEALSEFFSSKAQTAKESENASVNEYDLDSLQHFFIKHEIEHASMLVLHKQLLQEQELQQMINDKRMVKAEKWLLKLKKGLIQINSFIKDYIDKQMKAQKLIAEQKRIHRRLHFKTITLSKQNNELKKFRRKLIATSDEYKPYETVIQQAIAERSNRFKTEQELMDYCYALMNAYSDIEKLKEQKYQELGTGMAIKSINNYASTVVIAMILDLNGLTIKLDKARSECRKWEKTLEYTTLHCDIKYFEHERTRDVIHNLYVLLCKRQNLTPILQRSQIELQLDFIKEEFYILQKVVEKCENPLIHN